MNRKNHLATLSPPHLVTSACFLALALCLLALPACSLSQPFPDRATYALTLPHPEKASASSTLTLRVMPMHIAKPYDSQLFTYKTGPAQFTQDYYAGFISPPDLLLTAQLIDWLNDSAAVRYAAPAGTPLDCSATLESQLSSLYADHANNTAVIELRIFVISESIPSKVLFQKVYQESEPLPSHAPAALVAAWSAAYQRILTQLAADLKALPTQPQ